MKLSVAALNLFFGLTLKAAVTVDPRFLGGADEAGKKGSSIVAMSVEGGKKGGMSMIEVPTSEECPAVTPLTCGADETGSGVTEVIACETRLEESGVYTLPADLECALTESESAAITIASDFVTLDCQNNSVLNPGDRAAKGIQINAGVSNVILKNCVIENFQTGIFTAGSGANNLLMKNIKASGNLFGLAARGDNTIVLDSQFDNNIDNGLSLNGEGVIVVDSTANNNANPGECSRFDAVGIAFSPNDGGSYLLSGFTATGNRGSGLRLDSIADGDMVNVNLHNVLACSNGNDDDNCPLTGDIRLLNDSAERAISQSGVRCGSAAIGSRRFDSDFCQCPDCP